MTIIRSFIFTILWIVWTSLWCGSCSPLLIFKKGSAIIEGVRQVWVRGTLVLLKIVCGISHEVIGMENLPKGPFVVVSKHQSAWETCFLAIFFNATSFISKKDLTKIPFYGWYLTKLWSIMIDRKAGIKTMRDMKKGVEEAIENNRIVIIFPEGTRTDYGYSIPYKPGVKFLYDSFNDRVPFVPIALNSGKYWVNKSIVKKPGVIKMKILPQLNLSSSETFLTKLQDLIDGESNAL